MKAEAFLFGATLQKIFVTLSTVLTLIGALSFFKPMDVGQHMGTGGLFLAALWIAWLFGLAGLAVAALCGFRGWYVGAVAGVGFSLALCAWNLATYKDYGELLVSPSHEEYVTALMQLFFISAFMLLIAKIKSKVPQGWAAAVRILGNGAGWLWLGTLTIVVFIAFFKTIPIVKG